MLRQKSDIHGGLSGKEKRDASTGAEIVHTPERCANDFGAYAGTEVMPMIFAKRDIELLLLLRWCRYIDPNDLTFLDCRTIENLEGM